MQIVCNGTSSRLRKRALRDATYSLENKLIDGRKAETSTAQAIGLKHNSNPTRCAVYTNNEPIKHVIFVVWHTHMEINLSHIKILFAVPVESVDIFPKCADQVQPAHHSHTAKENLSIRLHENRTEN